eukprot:501995_1
MTEFCVNGKFDCNEPDCDKNSYRNLHMYYLIGASLTICGSLFVILTYLFSPSLRKHPSVLIFGRSVFDCGFGLSFVTLFFFATKDLSDLICDNTVCGIMGPFNLFVFLCSQGYFLSLLIDLYLSISNPFLNDISYTNIMHFSVISIAILSIIIVQLFWTFRYNDDLQYCTIAPTEDNSEWNLFNWCFIYGPTLFCMIFSIFITLYAFRRLKKGLPNTFFIRIKALKDTLFYSVTFTVYFCIIGLTYFVTWNTNIDRQHDRIWFISYAISSSLLGVIDFIVWILRKWTSINQEYFNETFEFLSTKHNKKKTIIDKKAQGLSTTHKYQRSDSNSTTSHTLELLTNSQINGKEDEIKVRESQSNSQISQSQSNSRSRFSTNKTKSSIQPALPQRVFNEFVTETEEDSDGDNNENKMKKSYKNSRLNCCKKLFSRFGIKQKSNSAMINKALRREIVAYTTDGIAQSVIKSGNNLNKPVLKFKQLKDFWYPLNIDDHNAIAVENFKIRIKFNTTLLDNKGYTVVPNSNDSVKFCCCFIMDNNSISGNGKQNHHHNVVTENSNLLASSSSTHHSRGNKEREREFTDYAPLIFRYIRNNIIGISDNDYISSIIPDNEEDQIKVLDVKYGEGKSGAFFYFTWDSRFIVKTVSKKEVKYLLSFLKEYVLHLENNRNTTISRIVGIHSCKFYNIVKHFVVMENVFIGELKPNEIYDLKGSWEGRFTKYGLHSGKTLKDLDLKRYII